MSGLVVTDIDQVFPDTTITVVPYATGSLRETAVELSDGRILYVFRQGGSIKQGYAVNINQFFGLDYTVTDVTTIIASAPYASSSVFFVGTALYLATCWSGEVRIYRSPGNLGGDWTLYSTIHSDGGAGDEQPDQRVVSMPHISGSTWTIAGPQFVQPFGVGGAKECVYTSTDNGLTWGQVVNTGYHILGGIFGAGVGRTVGEHDGKLWASTTSGNTSFGGDKLYYSTDNGVSWTQFFGNSDVPRNFNVSDGTYLYDIRYGSIYRSSNPTDQASWSFYRSYSISSGRKDSMVCPVGDKWMVSGGGTMVAGVQRGWVVGAVSMGGSGLL